MKKFEFSKDIISFVAVLITFIALLVTLNFPEILDKYFLPLLVILFLVIFMYITNYFRMGIEEHEKELNKLNEKINIYKDISDLKSRVEFIFERMGKKGQNDIIELFIRLIQIGAIIFAGYVIIMVIVSLN